MYFKWLSVYVSIPLSVLFHAWVCGRSLPGIAGSTPAADLDVSYECCVFAGRSLSDGQLLVQFIPTLCDPCINVISKSQKLGGP